ncbi:MAG TPA: phenylalanine--tRNA ligase subunit alpha [Candidatus Paceibacterota bacterium]|nr:phenylalanine--tRNA ligase subunit alpha [Candidatus Paceibacterota bacterium]
MDDRIRRIRDAAKKEWEQLRDAAELELAKVRHLGRKSELNELLRGLKERAEEERREWGPKLQNLRQELEDGFRTAAEKAGGVAAKVADRIDVTAPGLRRDRGHVHPLTQAQESINAIFSSMGFRVLEGPEVETAWNNFDALNIPPDHPARALMDTFWLKGEDALMRTHTSPMQVRFMQAHQPPFRIIVPGRVYRNEATDATHEFQFHQVEGLMVSRRGADGVSMANLKGILEHFYRRYFNDPGIVVRFNASYFPFTEPSVEVFMKAARGKLAGRWIEIGGAGMVHQDVFKAVGYVPGEFQGFAFGMSLERPTMLKYGIDDVRLFHGGDIRFLRQF